MDSKAFSIFTSLEGYLNTLVLRLFPTWYLSQMAKNTHLGPIGRINPTSYLRHRWLSLHGVISGMLNSLPSEDPWMPLHKLGHKLINETDHNRRIPLMAINGIEQSSHEGDWTTLIAFAEDNVKEIEINNAEEFDEQIFKAFPEENKPHKAVFREWDGRCYWINPGEPDLVAALQRYAHLNHRDSQIAMSVSLESLNSKVLEAIRHSWWLLLARRDDLLPFYDITKKTDLPIIMADFEWRRGDLAFLIAPKDNSRLNKIFLNLIQTNPGHTYDFGSYLARQYHPFNSINKKEEN